jgi:integrase/recombinase XerD
MQRKRKLPAGVRLFRRGKTWYLAYRDPVTRRVKKESTGLQERQAAELLVPELTRELELRGQNAVHWLDALKQYFESIKKPGTQATWRSCARRLDATFQEQGLGTDPWLHEITVEVIEAHVIRRRRQKVTDATIRAEMAMLSGLFAFMHVKPALNPVHLYDTRRLKRARKVVRWLTADEEDRLLKACQHEVHRRMIIFAIETGLRQQEQLSLEPSQLLWPQAEVWVPGDKAKNRQPRTVPLSRRAVAALQGLVTTEARHVFRSPITKERYVRLEGSLWWTRARRAAGVDCRWHDLRHTFASRWLQDGGDLGTLSKLLGHANINMTMRYAHLATSGLRFHLEQVEQIRARRAKYVSPKVVPNDELKKVG